jgi:hypothetical protein
VAEFIVDVHTVEEVANYLDTAGEDIMQRFQEGMIDASHQVIRRIFEQAWAGLSEDQFPAMYRNHLLEAMNSQPVVVGARFSDGAGVEVRIEELGSEEELERAYHRHAQLAEGGTVEGPYEGEELKNDTQERHDFWEALVHGKDYEGINPKTGKRYKIPARKLAGKWQQTLSEYMQIWGAKAPYWRFLEYGTGWTPNIPPFAITEQIQYEITEVGNELWNAEWATALNNMQRAGLYESRYSYSNLYSKVNVSADPKGNYHTPSGGLTIGGKKYRRGQFLPKNVRG